MIVRMLTQANGPKFNAAPGDHREVSEEMGRALIAGLHAIEVDPGAPAAAARETATAARRAKR